MVSRAVLRTIVLRERTSYYREEANPISDYLHSYRLPPKKSHATRPSLGRIAAHTCRRLLRLRSCSAWRCDWRPAQAARAVGTDRGYRGHNAPPDNKMNIYISAQKRGLTDAIKRDLRRRSAVEPIIGTRGRAPNESQLPQRSRRRQRQCCAGRRRLQLRPAVGVARRPLARLRPVIAAPKTFRARRRLSIGKPRRRRKKLRFTVY